MYGKHNPPRIVAHVDQRSAKTPDMLDEDGMLLPVEMRFDAGESLQEGVGGRTSIDAKYENTHEVYSETQRSGENAPEPLDRHLFMHREF